MRPPQQDPFLSFSHTFLLKNVCAGGWHPPNGSAPPQWEILDLPLKGTPKWRECIFSNEIPKSFQGPKAGPGPHAEKGLHDAAVHCWQFRPVMIWGPPLIKSWIRPWLQ